MRFRTSPSPTRNAVSYAAGASGITRRGFVAGAALVGPLLLSTSSRAQIGSMSLKVSDSEKAIARHLETVFGSRPRIFINRESEDDPLYIGIARVEDYPGEAMVTLSTIGTSNSPLMQEDETEYAPTRVEFIATCEEGQERDVEQALFKAALFVAKGKGFARPGMFLDDLFGRFRPSTPVPHAYLTTPFAYEGLIDRKDFAGRTVSWLQIVPVSSSEIDYSQTNSTDALETLFEERDVDWSNLDRAPVV